MTGVPDVRIRGVHLRLPGSSGPEPGPVLEIFSFEPAGPDTVKTIHRSGFSHLAFLVDDVEAVLGEVRSRMGELDPEAETLLICQSGHRSATAAKWLTRAGFEHAYSVKGGTSAWTGPLKR